MMPTKRLGARAKFMKLQTTEKNGLPVTADRQVTAAQGIPIQWHFAEEGAAAAMQNRVPPGISVFHTPMRPL